MFTFQNFGGKNPRNSENTNTTERVSQSCLLRQLFCDAIINSSCLKNILNVDYGNFTHRRFDYFTFSQSCIDRYFKKSDMNNTFI